MGGYRVELLAACPGVDEAALIAFWRREGATLRDREASRVHEVLFVALDGAGELAAECSAYLQPDESLGLNLWFLRAMTARDHRMNDLAASLVRATHEHLEDRFRRGEDRRGAGAGIEVENPGLSTRGWAVWPSTGFTFVGVTSRGHHLRVSYFEGSLAPELPA